MNQENWSGITEAEVEQIVRRVLAAQGYGAARPEKPAGHRISAVKTSFFGQGSVKMLGPEIRKLGIRRALIVTDSFLAGSGAADRVRAVLEESGAACALFDRVQPNPTVQVVNECIARAKETGAELLAAVGAWTHNQRADRLLQIAADGEVDELEVAGFRQILADLDEIVQAALQVKFAEDKEEGLL